MSEKKSKSAPEIEYLVVKGARMHNLKNIDLTLPRNQFVVITGVSGSGKSSLAFDTIYAEGQRRYMETLSSYARQFIGEMERPDVEYIEGLSPVISIEQKTVGSNPRSTVGTITEIYDFLRLLFARVGEGYSYNTGKKMVSYTTEQVIEHINNSFANQKIAILAPIVRGRKGNYKELFEQYRKLGYTKVCVNGKIEDLVQGMAVDRYVTHNIEVVIDRIIVEEDKTDRLIKALQLGLKIGRDLVFVLNLDTEKIHQYSKKLMCEDTGISYEIPSPNAFSFNSPYGYCPSCKGLGVTYEVDMKAVIPDDTKNIEEVGIAPLGEVRSTMIFEALRVLAKKHKFSFSTPIKDIPPAALQTILYGGENKMALQQKYGGNEWTFSILEEGLIKQLKRWYEDTASEQIREWATNFMHIINCPECQGARLKKESLYFKIADKNIAELSQMDIQTLFDWVNSVEGNLSERQKAIGKDIFKELKERLGFLLNVGLNYLNLSRPAGTLSGGESQRIRLATQIGSQLTGITYILDEPSIGLHQRDNEQLIVALRQLTDIGNTVLVVEHDKDIMLAADYLVDLGPAAGKHGGELVAAGKPADFLLNNSMTAQYLSNTIGIEIPKERRKGNGKKLVLKGATGNNLKNVNLELPLGTFICVTGVSGSGKSTLINDTLYPILRHHFFRSKGKPLAYTSIEGLEHLDKVIEIDQSPIGRTPRSNPVTYTNVFTDIRNLFATLPESKIRGYKTGRFSFNVKGGRCETCEGGGQRLIEMNFLPSVSVTCETCFGKRYNRETLEVKYRAKSISDILDMTVEEAVVFFEHIPKIQRKIKTLNDVGLGYISLGQSAVTLSGGEAQRVKLAEELSKKDTGNTIYILDEPTTGLHFEDIRILLNVLQALVDKGNTILVIEHNTDVIKVADYIIDIGLEGGHKGGEIIAQGTPELVATVKASHTGRFIAKELRNTKH